ncbi:hypothetical protein KSP40_PGU002261 [Platanthera guangdongensis]|uniref:Uncharacterized protein n=1 Tax=Platanthera guangdongensis TaxID=2320717 RepID=A0ABR2MUV8_9ASPA
MDYVEDLVLTDEDMIVANIIRETLGEDEPVEGEINTVSTNIEWETRPELFAQEDGTGVEEYFGIFVQTYWRKTSSQTELLITNLYMWLAFLTTTALALRRRWHRCSLAAHTPLNTTSDTAYGSKSFAPFLRVLER